MSGNDVVIEVTKRETVRKGLNTLRTENIVPGVLHNHGKESLLLQADYIALRKVFQSAGKHHPVQVVIDGKKHLALIKDVDVEPTKNKMRHIVFQAIRQNETTTAEIPVVLADVEIPAERAALLVLRHIDTVDVEALPSDLPDELVADPSSLKDIGDTLTVADLKVPPRVTVLTEAEQGIATVEMPRDQIAEADEAAEALAQDEDSAEEVPATEQSGDDEESEDSETDEDAEKTE